MARSWERRKTTSVDLPWATDSISSSKAIMSLCKGEEGQVTTDSAGSLVAAKGGNRAEDGKGVTAFSSQKIALLLTGF